MALWTDIAAEIQKQFAEVNPRRMFAGSKSNGKMTLRDIRDTVPGDELYATLEGMSKISLDDEVAVIFIGGKPIVLGALSRLTQAAITYDLPIIGEQGFNSPYLINPVVSNSAVTASTTSTSLYSINVQSAGIVLPTGTWDVLGVAGGLFAHTNVNGSVRVHLQVGSDAGTALTVATQADPGRSYVGLSNLATNQTGTIDIRLEYRPNSTLTAFAGGGWVYGLAFRKS
jgi:hypothetical protein